MAGSLAHELNQPLAAILSSAQAALRFLKAGRMEPDLLREILTNIIKDDKRAASIIRGMRSMLKKEAPDFERLDVNRTVAEGVAIFQGEAVARRTQVETDLNQALPPVMASRNQLLQVFLNLLLNAAQAMASNRGDDRQVVITTRVIGPNVVVSVRDIGTGIESDRFDRLFEALYTTKAKGMGMGLAVCRSIVENHGGRIRAENNPDRGATFTIELLAVTNG
jgi:C4-dicarboxylate-specific signal transduction histidine kinase